MASDRVPEDRGRTAYLRAEQLERVCREVEKFRRQLRQEAIAYAEDALYNWVAKGVERYSASCRSTRGWIFLLDSRRENGRKVQFLSSIPAATWGSANRTIEIPLDRDRSSAVAYVYKEKEGLYIPDVNTKPPAYHEIDPGTQAELAVPLFDENGPDDGTVIGVYNLEADQINAFTSAYVGEIKRNGALLTLHLLVLRQAQASAGQGSWVWNPEVHGWSPGRLMERFCHTVARALAREDETPPVCSVWTADPLSGRCWVLGTSGYDYEFLNANALDPDNSVVGRVAQAATRAIARGSPEELDFACRRKAIRLGVQQAVITSLHGRPEAAVQGTFNVYALKEQTAPSDAVMKLLAEQAEQFLASLNTQRIAFAKAHIGGQLVKAVSPNASLRLFRRALMTVLPADAQSIFVPDKKGRLRYVEGTDFDPGVTPSKVRYEVEPEGKQKSLTAYCFTHPNKAVCVNFDEDDPIYLRNLIPDLPLPSQKFRDRIVVEDAYHRRRLMIGVESLGTLREYRSGKNRPFTGADQKLLEGIADWSICRDVFRSREFEKRAMVAANVHGATPTLLQEELRQCVGYFRAGPRSEEEGGKIQHGCVFVLWDETQPQYRGYAYHSHQHQMPPDDFLTEPSSDLGSSRDEITVARCGLRNGAVGLRVGVPLRVWTGAQLVQAIFALDFDATTLELHKKDRRHIFWASVRCAALFARNEWLDPAGSKPGLREYQAWVNWTGKTQLREAAFHFPPNPACRLQPGWEDFRDPALRAYGVQWHRDLSRLLVPLFVGPSRVAELTCALDPSLGVDLDRFQDLSSHSQPRTEKERDEEMAFWRKLRCTVGRVAGAWARIIAGDPLLWKVKFLDDQGDGETTLWRPDVRYQLPLKGE